MQMWQQGLLDASQMVGAAGLKPLADAPGTYVLEP
jgi:hypothetical protein